MRVSQMIAGGVRLLTEASVPSPEVDARILAEYVLEVGNLVYAPPQASAQALADYAELISRRARREPLQHILGTMWFRGLELTARAGVFVVRPETEIVAQAAIDAANGVTGARIVDLCTGSGAIAISCAVECPNAQVWAVELGAEPFALAKHNISRHGDTVTLIQGDATSAQTLAELDGQVDVVISNPPYVPPTCVPIDPEVRDFDPDLALYGGGIDGLEVPTAIVKRSWYLLKPGGTIVVEHGEAQGQALRECARETGFVNIFTGRDLTDRDRYLQAQKPANQKMQQLGSRCDS